VDEFRVRVLGAGRTHPLKKRRPSLKIGYPFENPALPELPALKHPIDVGTRIYGLTRLRVHGKTGADRLAIRFRDQTHYFDRTGSNFYEADQQRMEFHEGTIILAGERIPVLFFREIMSTQTWAQLEKIVVDLPFRAMWNRENDIPGIAGSMFYQDIRWGPTGINIHVSQIQESHVHVSQIQESHVWYQNEKIDPTWFDKQGRWVNSEYEYMARELIT